MEEIDIAPDDGEPQPRAFDVNGVGAAEKTAEKVLFIFCADANTLVPHRDGHASIGKRPDLQVDGSTFATKFYGIAKEVDQDILKQVFVAVYHMIACIATMDDLTFFSEGLHFFGQVLQELPQWQGRRFGLYLPFRQFTERKEISQQLVKMFDGVPGTLDMLVALILVFGSLISGQQVGGG